ncbi:hypothetical protein [Puia sp.]|jgi:hypothetical protein|uniref:hypothetical protein n=1 Tax=Puia sp. TaxID=2045100 RepID=UPI002F406933
MAVVLTNLSNRRYEESRLRLNASAERYGIDRLRSLDWEDLRTTPFYEENRGILDRPTGMGYWLWKPFIILEALNAVAEGDIVIYADSGLEIVASLEPLFDLCRNGNPILLFGNADFSNSMWTKRDCFILMGCDGEAYWKAPQCDAAFAVFRRCEASLRFVSEWLDHCRDGRILTDDANTCGRRNLPDFVEHRRDQSVLSLMAAKHRISLFRMPTQFGNHYKAPAFRLADEFNCVNQNRRAPVDYYALIPYYNSPYFQLLDHHRHQNKNSGDGGKQKGRGPFSLIVRIIGKWYRRWLNTYDLWRHKHPT